MTMHASDLGVRERIPETKPALGFTLTTAPRILLLGIPILAITEAECVRLVIDELKAGRGGWLMTLNLDHLRRLVREPSYAASVALVNCTIADGMPLIWASRLQNTPLPERVTGSSLIWSLSRAAAAHGHSIFLLGGSSDTAMRSAEILRETYPPLHVAGVYAPPIGFEQDQTEMEQLCENVVRAGPDIVYVALGSPKADNLIARLRAAVPRAWFLGVGISFSWVSGDLPRAPRWMQQAGLEWLHRLWHEPLRLGRRYLIDDLPFALVLFAHVLKHRLRLSRRTR